MAGAAAQSRLALLLPSGAAAPSHLSTSLGVAAPSVRQAARRGVSPARAPARLDPARPRAGQRKGGGLPGATVVQPAPGATSRPRNRLRQHAQQPPRPGHPHAQRIQAGPIASSERSQRLSTVSFFTSASISSGHVPRDLQPATGHRGSTHRSSAGRAPRITRLPSIRPRASRDQRAPTGSASCARSLSNRALAFRPRAKTTLRDRSSVHRRGPPSLRRPAGAASRQKLPASSATLAAETADSADMARPQAVDPRRRASRCVVAIDGRASAADAWRPRSLLPIHSPISP